MRIERDAMYFEPRVINDVGIIHWFGGCYQDVSFLSHTTETVYIRDDGEYLFVYSLYEDDMKNKQDIHATFKLVCQIKKHNDQSVYGKSRTRR